VFFCKTRSFALRFLLENSHKRFASCHGQLSSGAIEVPIRSHRAVCRILFDKKIFLDRTGPPSDQSEHIFDNHYKFRSICYATSGSSIFDSARLNSSIKNDTKISHYIHEKYFSKTH
jgi:hypothetical protein